MLLALVKTVPNGRQIDMTNMLVLIWGPQDGAKHHTGSGTVPIIISAGLHLLAYNRPAQPIKDFPSDPGIRWSLL